MTPRRLVSLALTLAVVAIATWPRSPSSGMGAEEPIASPYASASTHRMAVRGATVGCSSCHVLRAAAPAELACRQPGAASLQLLRIVN